MALLENQSTLLTLSASLPAGCTGAPTISLSILPLHGVAALAQNTGWQVMVAYQPHAHYLGNDSFTLVVTGPTGIPATRTVSLTITPSVAEFAGDEERLDEYRDRLSVREVQHLLCKFALCGNPWLRNYGLINGRRALVDLLFSYDTNSLAQPLRAWIQQSLGGATPEQFGFARAHEVSRESTCSSSGRLWNQISPQYWWLVQLTRGNLLREQIALHLYQHMPINTSDNLEGGPGGGCSSQYSYYSYINMLRTHALGRQNQGPLEAPANGNARELFREMLTDYQMSLYLSNFQPIIPATPSYPFNHYLVGVHNNNFARELLQVFTIGQYNVFDGSLNYTERDVQNVARSLAGVAARSYLRMGVDDMRIDPEMIRRPWRVGDNINGQVSYWDANLREVGQKTIFEQSNNPLVRRTGDLTPDDVLGSIMNHPGLAYFSRSLFQRTVYPGPSTSLVTLLHNRFKTDFNIPNFLRTLMNSSATFSPRARSSCISSGTVHMLRLLNTLQLPVLPRQQSDNPVASCPDGIVRSSTQGGYFPMVLRLMSSMGDSILSSPSIFGLNECGDGDGHPDENNFGRSHLSTQNAVGRLNAPFKLMKYYLEGDYPWNCPTAQEGFTIQQLLPAGIPDPTPTQVVNHFEELFGVSLRSEERGAILEFLDPPQNPNAPSWNPNRPPWSTSVREARVANLVAIFANLPDVNVR